MILFAYNPVMRDNKFLESKLDKIINNHFADVKISNNVRIKFGRKAVKRLGSIRRVEKRGIRGLLARNTDTEITLSGYFRDTEVPEYVLDAVIAHELCHYSHGFSSPLPQLYEHPHKGNIVEKEMKKRGLGPILIQHKKWIENQWFSYIRSLYR